MRAFERRTVRRRWRSGLVRLAAGVLAASLLLAGCAPGGTGEPDGTGEPATAPSDAAGTETDESLPVPPTDATGPADDESADAASVAAMTDAEPAELTYEGNVAAPEFPAGYDWFNVSRPLSMSGDLRGKIVLLDFWTQGCINCIHIIPDLHRLEAEYPDEVVVIAVHWAKFPSERESEAVREASIRYGRQHPIVNDDQELLRAEYGVNAWPTVAVVDPTGKVVGTIAGEGVYERLEPVIELMAAEYGQNGLIDPTPLGELLEIAPALPTVLSFPGKVLADEAGGRLFIADTGRHRVLVATLAGELIDVIGAGSEGRADGDFGEATFRRPQGMALSPDGTTLYIADRENHLIRAASLDSRAVTTVAGTGEPVTVFRPGPAAQTPIASPWDLHLEGDVLYIAGAGRHQIWLMNLTSGAIDYFAGTGAEGLDDGNRLEATLSQPSGFAAADGVLYFTDPEASAVRQVSLGPDGQLSTLVGLHLFVWGDELGSFDDTLLQHAIGIEHVGRGDGRGVLYIADTYNHKIKVLDLDTMTSSLVAGDGIAGLRNGSGADARLAEPSGLSATSDTLYVADTNNHRIRMLDLATGELSTLVLSNLEIATVTMAGVIEDDVVLLPQRVAPGPVAIVLDLRVPEGYKFNSDGLFEFEWSAEGDVLRPEGSARYEARGPELPYLLAGTVSADSAGGGTAVLTATAVVFYCPAVDETFCLIRDVNFTAPIEVDSAGGRSIYLHHQLLSAEELDRRLAPG
ncbi:thioredoxin-like domain-containing protein [Candidatus Poriferisodalis sp.]|uniref:thioredoxin-like domain-containing protein n=1 Tax=Candidatus Poriferisodalis sp. TaxID=3101277 RepID=UPI003B01FEED